MRKFFRSIFSFFFKQEEKQEEIKDSLVELSEKEITSPKLNELEIQKQKAIELCDGCENEVFVLKLFGEDVDYAPSLHQLIVRNKLPKTSTYSFWNNKQHLNAGELSGLLMNKYDIVKLS